MSRLSLRSLAKGIFLSVFFFSFGKWFRMSMEFNLMDLTKEIQICNLSALMFIIMKLQVFYRLFEQKLWFNMRFKIEKNLKILTRFAGKRCPENFNLLRFHNIFHRKADRSFIYLNEFRGEICSSRRACWSWTRYHGFYS